MAEGTRTQQAESVAILKDTIANHANRHSQSIGEPSC
jgi:hypothetical protein